MKLVKDLGIVNGVRLGVYLCKCGKEKEVLTYNVKSGRTKSCGCLRGEAHGLKGSSTYNSWANMKNRCLSLSHDAFKDYGGRGVKICSRWKSSFNAFLEDMGERPNGHTLDRVNNNGNYEAKNCKWSTREEQANNTRSNVVITEHNVSLTIAQWAKVLEVPRGRIYGRLNLGWSNHDALLMAKVAQENDEGLAE